MGEYRFVQNPKCQTIKQSFSLETMLHETPYARSTVGIQPSATNASLRVNADVKIGLQTFVLQTGLFRENELETILSLFANRCGDANFTTSAHVRIVAFIP